MSSRTFVYCSFLWLLLNGFLSANAQWTAVFNPNAVTVTMGTTERVQVILSGLTNEIIERINDRSFVSLATENSQVANVEGHDDIEFVQRSDGSWETSFEINGIFLGKNIFSRFLTLKTVKLINSLKGASRIFLVIGTERSNSAVDVTVLRLQRIVDTIFAVSIIILLGILFINFGAAIDMTVMKSIVVKPVRISS